MGTFFLIQAQSNQELCVRVSHKISTKVVTKAVVSSEGSAGGGFASKFTEMVIGKTQLTQNCWTEGLDSIVVVSLSLLRFFPHGPLQLVLSE